MVTSRRVFALQPDFCTQMGHSWAAHRTILMPHTSSISITFDRTDNVAFSTVAKAAANRFFGVRLTVPREGHLDASMRRGLCSLWRPSFRATPELPPGSPWRTTRTGARPRRQSAATQALPNQSMPVARPVPGVSITPDATRQTARELKIRVADGGAPIDGLVALSGLPNGLQSLNAECGQK